jgi:hypothetical protein
MIGKIYANAWRALKVKLQDKNSWGKNELIALMNEVLEAEMAKMDEPGGEKWT